MTLISHERLRSAAFAASLAASAAALTACDPPPTKELLVGPNLPSPFVIESFSPGRGAVPADGALVLHATDDVDAKSVGPRSVRVTRVDGRPVRVRAWVGGRELRVAPLPGREFPAEEKLRIRIEGAPSPRSVRSTSGEPLALPFETTFRVGPRLRDLVGPRLVDSLPRDGAERVAPGSCVELRFSEPLARGSVATGDAVSLRVDGSPVGARLVLSGDGSMIVVHPASPLPPDRRVDVEVHGCLLDVAGNPIDGASVRTLSFRTLATSQNELSEDFVDSGKCDSRATSCGWDDPEAPGMLVGRSGAVLVGPDAGEPLFDLGDASPLHFQIVVPGGESTNGLASALRVEFAAAPPGARLLSAVVEAGPTTLDSVDPSFAANRAAARLATVARVVDPVDVDVDANDGGRPFVDVAFEAPLRLEAGRPVLLDVRLELDPGARVAAWRDVAALALVEGKSAVAPAASLLVTPASPQARSLWYDTGVAYPGWRPASVFSVDADPGVNIVAEFQSAPASADGGADASRASPWDADLERLPAHRFVRFRLRFEGTPDSGVAPRIDRIVLPYER
jgi:hypothetical protein